jgi:peptide/nickel transport system permease protein
MRHRLAMVGLVVMLVLVLATIFAPLITPRNPLAIDPLHRYAPPLHAGYLLGSDDLGRDVFSRLLYAGRISLTVGLAAMAVTIVVGSLVGATAAYYGGTVDILLMRLTDMVLCFPNIFLLLFLAAFISPGLGPVALIIGLTAWMEVARIVHAQVLALKEQDFILAAQLLGLPRWRIVLRHILPNTMAPILVAATLNIANAILLESYISFLGYGIQPPTASWGNMLYNAQSDFALDPWLAIFPGIMITLAVMSFNFIGDGLRDALDPRLTI